MPLYDFIVDDERMKVVDQNVNIDQNIDQIDCQNRMFFDNFDNVFSKMNEMLKCEIEFTLQQINFDA